MTEAEQFLLKHGINPGELIDDWLRPWSAKESKIRNLYIEKYGFAVLTAGVVEALRPFNPIVEVGAGCGYWAYEMKKAGVDVIATEPYPERVGVYSHANWKMFTDFKKLNGPRAAAKYPERTLMMVWPDFGKRWTSVTLLRYLEAGGQRLIYVGESSGGCTGNAEFHDIIENSFKEETRIDIPVFQGLHDRLLIYHRR